MEKMNIVRGVYPRPAIRQGYTHIESFDEIDFNDPRVIESLAAFYLKLLERNSNVPSTNEYQCVTTEMGNASFLEESNASAENYIAVVA